MAELCRVRFSVNKAQIRLLREVLKKVNDDNKQTNEQTCEGSWSGSGLGLD